MKKTILLLMLIPAFTLSAAAQEKKISAGLGPEFNWNARHDFAGGAALGVYFNLPNFFAAGVSVTGSSNFNDISTVEPTALFRWYFQKKGYTGFFAQLSAGAFIIFEEEGVTPMIDAGLSGGYRLPLGASFYLEPYLRLGYPFGFGVGVTGGMRF